MDTQQQLIDKIESLQRSLMAENAKLAQENKHVNVAFLGAEIARWKLEYNAKLALFDGNHTHAQAALVDRIKQLEERLDSSAIFVRDLQKRIKKMEDKQPK